MKLIYFISIVLGIKTAAFSQKNGVIIIEEKTDKRHLIYAKNTTNEIRSVFLKVTPIGYRRTANRPVIKTIPPHTKSLLTTLIPLKNTPNSYTYIYTANKEQKNLTVNRVKPAKELNLSEVIKNEIVIFTTDDCKKCVQLIGSLKNKRIKYREININQNNRFYVYAWKLLEEKGYNTKSILLPIASIKGKIITTIRDMDSFISQIPNESLSSK